MDSRPQTAGRETTRAEGLARQAARLSDQEVQEFAKEFEEQRRMREAQKSAPINEAQGYAEQDGASGGPSYGLTGYGSQELGLANIEDAMKYQPWHSGQMEQGEQVRDALTFAAKVILRCVPRSPLRTRALNNIIDCRMLANAAITFGGRF